MPWVVVTLTYLALPPEHPVPDTAPPHGVSVALAELCPPALARDLYVRVGGPWHWHDRLPWSDQQWRDHLERNGVSIHLLLIDGATAGYFELARHDDGGTEIAYFGLLPQAQGRGLGRWLLEQAALEARRHGGTVWVHTCTLDGPAALPNYLARGFVPTREEQYTTLVPDT